MAHTERAGNLVNGNDRRITLTAFKAADVLLAQSATFSELFLSQLLLASDPRSIPANELAHVHAQTIGEARLPGLSTIVCIRTQSCLGRQIPRKFVGEPVKLCSGSG